MPEAETEPSATFLRKHLGQRIPLTRLGWITAIIFIVGLAFIVVYTYPRHIPPQPPSECRGCALQRPLRVGIVTWPGYASGIIANEGFEPNRKSLFFRHHDLCVEFLLLEDIEKRREAIRGGRNGVDVVWATIDELPMFLSDGSKTTKAKVIMQVDWSRGGDAIIVASNVKRIEDLYQKKIAFVFHSPSRWLLEFSLQNSRLNLAQQREIMAKSLVDNVNNKSSIDARDEFVNGKADAAVVRDPDISEAKKGRPEARILASTTRKGEASRLIAGVMLLSEDLIEKSSSRRGIRNAIEDFIEGWIIDGTKEATQIKGKEHVARLLMRDEIVYEDLRLVKTLQSLEEVKLADLSDNAALFNLDDHMGGQPSLFDQIYVKAASVERPDISAPLRSSAEVKDLSFIRQIYERRFGRPLPPIIVTFEVGSALLSEESQRLIDEKEPLLAKALLDGYRIQVEGNTDPSVGSEGNGTLSRRRAEEIVNYLVSKHRLPFKVFDFKGNGSNKPIALNDTAENRARNRRAEIRLAKK